MNFKEGSYLNLLKEGTRHLSGLEQAILKNISAVEELSQKTRTSMGPNGLNKLVINQHKKIFVTHDSTTILTELEVIHPAAKIAIMACASQEQEIGDGSNFVISFIGELLKNAADLLTVTRLHPSDVISGYKLALNETLKQLENLVVTKVDDLRNPKQVEMAMKAAISAKQYSYEEILSPLIAKACIGACPKNPKKFNVDNIRSVKIPGASVWDSFIVNGLCFAKNTEGTVKHIKNAKIVVFGCSIDIQSLDTKETVEIKNAEELLNYSKSEEKVIEKDISDIASTGVNVIVTNGSFSEMAMHFIEKYNIMAVKLTSKFEMRRLCKAVGASILIRIGKPTEDEIGFASEVNVKEIGDTKVLTFQQNSEEITSPLSTVIIRGPTNNILNEIERAINDGVNVYKALTQDNRLLPGAGAIEMELYKMIKKFSEKQSGLEQYAIKKFAESFLVIPKTLSETSGLFTTDVIASLTAAHEDDAKKTWGININSGSDFIDTLKENILDVYLTKYWAIKLATDAAITILSVDQIVMARPSGGPKLPKGTSTMDSADADAF